jgi:hypothetical protein
LVQGEVLPPNRTGAYAGRAGPPHLVPRACDRLRLMGTGFATAASATMRSDHAVTVSGRRPSVCGCCHVRVPSRDVGRGWGVSPRARPGRNADVARQRVLTAKAASSPCYGRGLMVVVTDDKASATASPDPTGVAARARCGDAEFRMVAGLTTGALDGASLGIRPGRLRRDRCSHSSLVDMASILTGDPRLVYSAVGLLAFGVVLDQVRRALRDFRARSARIAGDPRCTEVTALVEASAGWNANLAAYDILLRRLVEEDDDLVERLLQAQSKIGWTVASLSRELTDYPLGSAPVASALDRVQGRTVLEIVRARSADLEACAAASARSS